MSGNEQVNSFCDGGPAFPNGRKPGQVLMGALATPDGVRETWVDVGGSDGMTLRDYFAAKAFAMLMHPEAKDYKPEETARQAYRFADAMLKARAVSGEQK